MSVSILDRFPLTKEVFEDKVIGIGTKKDVVCKIFRKTKEEMNDWCQENYGLNFDTTYELLKQMTYAEWKECLKGLGIKGNPTAMSIMQERLADEEDASANSIVFEVNVKMEDQDAKRCD